MHPLIASALNSGPAVDLYAALIADPPMSQRWLEEIRTRWGQPDHPSLALFPSVQEQNLMMLLFEFAPLEVHVLPGALSSSPFTAYC